MSAFLTPIDLPIDQKTSPHSRTEGEIEETSCRGSSPTVLANCGDVGVYINMERAIPFCFHHRFEGNIPPGGLVQGRDNSLFPIQRPTDGCTHAHDLFFRGHFIDHMVNICQVCFKTGGCGPSCASQDISITIS